MAIKRKTATYRTEQELLRLFDRLGWTGPFRSLGEAQNFAAKWGGEAYDDEGMAFVR